MTQPARDIAFVGPVPQIYQSHMVPLIFASYAREVATRVAKLSPAVVLEIACGTGVVTRALTSALPASTAITATDLNQKMLDLAATLGTSREVAWQQADAMLLPFADASFDVVVCQFGVMFFPDKARAFAEARRVLRDGGTFIFSVWDRIEENEFADVVITELASAFHDMPATFMQRVPHGYFDRATIARDLAAGGFTTAMDFATVTERSRAESALVPAVGYCQGTPLRGDIESRGAGSLELATAQCAAALAARFGDGIVDGKIQAHVITVTR